MAKKKTKITEESDIIELSDTEEESSVKSHGSLFNIKKKTNTTSGSDEPIGIIGNKTGDEQIHEDAFGMTLRGRNIIAYIITTFIVTAILAGSFTLAVYLPTDNDIIDSRAEHLLSNDEEYASLLKERAGLKDEISTLQSQSEEKETQIDNLNDYDNTMAGLDMKIKESREELASLKNQAGEKQAQLDGLNAQIAGKNSKQITLTPGVYTVGTHLRVGKYSVTGSGKFQVATSEGLSKVNDVLGDSPYTITLEQGDKVNIESSTKFTPVD